MGLETILGLALLLSLTFYALLGGADFGAGVWHLLAKGPSRKAQHRLIGEAIGPIWEANHVWLILIVTILFTAFPVAYVEISTTLHIPLTLLVIGIVLRGAAFTFRHYDIKDDDIHLRWDQLFAVSSLASPLMLGIVIGAITAGAFPVNPDTFFQGYISTWAQPFPLTMGLFTLLLFAYLAAAYLLLETQNPELREIFRKRAIVAALLTGLLEEGVLFLGKSGAPRLWGELTTSQWGGFIQLSVGGLMIVAATLFITRRYWWARTCAILQVTLTIWTWGIAQYPFLVPPYLTIFNASAPRITLQIIAWALLLGAILLFPCLFYLYHVFKRPALFGHHNLKD